VRRLWSFHYFKAAARKHISVSDEQADAQHAGSIACCQFYFMRFADFARFRIHDFALLYRFDYF
jgi:hypothetical protein